MGYTEKHSSFILRGFFPITLFRNPCHFPTAFFWIVPILRCLRFPIPARPLGDTAIDGSMGQTGRWDRLVDGTDWSMGQTGRWDRLVDGTDWSMGSMGQTGRWSMGQPS